MTPRSWTLLLEGERPWTTNTERSWSPFKRASKVAFWRARGQVVALVLEIPHLEAVRVRAHPLVSNRRGLQDVGGCFPCVKAVVDGLVDAKVLDDDGPDIVRELVFTGPEFGEIDGLLVVVEELLS